LPRIKKKSQAVTKPISLSHVISEIEEQLFKVDFDRCTAKLLLARTRKIGGSLFAVWIYGRLQKHTDTLAVKLEWQPFSQLRTPCCT